MRFVLGTGFFVFAAVMAACGSPGGEAKAPPKAVDRTDPLNGPVPPNSKFECIDLEAKKDASYRVINPADKPALPARTVADKFAFAPADHDGDGIDDEYDLCPTSAEDGKGAHPFDGCALADDQTKGRPTWPDVPRVIVKSDHIEITEQIHFAKGSAKILDGSKPLIAAIAQAILDTPSIELVEIAGHADTVGGNKDNLTLTKQRAASVSDALVARGVNAKWLRSMGYGEYCPIDRANTKVAFAKNRRVEFRIIRRDGKELSPWGGCDEAQKHGVKPPPPPTADLTRPKPKTPVVVQQSKGAPDYHGSCRVRAPECTDDCRGGSVEACYVGSHERSHSVESGPVATDRDTLKKDCDAQLFPSCSQLAVSLLSEPAQDHATALTLATPACDKGDGFGCGVEAFLLERGCAVQPDPATGYTVAKKGCAIDIVQSHDRIGSTSDRLACSVASRAMWNGLGGTRDHAGAYALDLKACASGLPHACIRLAQDALSEPALVTDRPKLVGTLHDMCEQQGWTPGAEDCVAMANVEKPGEYTSPKLCDAGGEVECAQACQNRDWEPCFDLYVADLYRGYRHSFDGLSPRTMVLRGLVEEAKTDHYRDSQAKIDEAAAESYAKACTATVPSGCVHHARMRLEGRGTLRDIGGAGDALDEWCDQGEKMACALLGQAMVTKKLPGGALEGQKKLAAACTAGLKWACKR